MIYCYLDIETLPNESPEVREEIAANILPPGNMSKRETIEAWEVEKKPALVVERMRATALDGTYGRVLAIGCAFDNDEPMVFLVPSESDVLRLFFNELSVYATLTLTTMELSRDVCFVGHNISSFDLRFLWQRAVVLGIKPPTCFMRAALGKPWSELLADTMLMWNPERERRISFDKLCRALGVPSSKKDLTGATVYDAWKAGEVQRIMTYSRDEVRAIRECFKCMRFMVPA